MRSQSALIVVGIIVIRNRCSYDYVGMELIIMIKRLNFVMGITEYKNTVKTLLS